MIDLLLSNIPVASPPGLERSLSLSRIPEHGNASVVILEAYPRYYMFNNPSPQHPLHTHMYLCMCYIEKGERKSGRPIRLIAESYKIIVLSKE